MDVWALTDAHMMTVVAPYVKVYLMEGKNCVEKQKTTIVRRTLDPLYQQQLYFTESYVGKILQVWAYFPPEYSL